LLSEVQTVIGPRCLSRQTRVTVDVASGLTGLCADRRGLKQILLNLLDNAVKAMQQPGTIEVSARLRGDGSVEVAVKDTGIGIPPERLNKLFQPFEQIDNRYAKSDYGVGLGLVLVKRLTELHDGTLEVESRPGEGTRVAIILPGERAVPSDRSPGTAAIASPSNTAVAAA
jgi:two-component system cell cycle sensor histidine kinase PleC